MKLRSLVLAALLFAGLPLASSSAFVAVSVGFAPPPLPVYVQPACPVEGYLWNPGYWGYNDVSYYWVPGVWVAPPRVGVYWTPGYWGYNGGSYIFNTGYWGPSVGYYGGINYGYGYGGSGYFGGEWAGGAFRYNTAVTRVNTTVIKNVYVNKTVIKNGTRPKGASFNGPNGVKAQPTAKEQAAAKGEKGSLTPEQQKVREAASKNPELNAKNNGGKPKLAAVKSPDEVAGGPDAGGAQKPGQKGGRDAADSDKPGQKGARADQPANDGQPPAAADANGDDAARGDKQANQGRAGNDNNKARKAEGIANDGAGPQEPKVGNGRRAGENGAANQTANRKIPAAADRGRAAQTVANRGAQQRTQSAVRRPKTGAQTKAAPARGRPAGAAAAPNKKKKAAQADGGGRRGGF